MKSKFAVSAVVVSLLLLGNLGWAQGNTNFAMVGLTKEQTLLFNVVAFPPTPVDSGSCVAVLGFQDSQGNAVGPTH
jgi:hypothetical protein